MNYILESKEKTDVEKGKNNNNNNKKEEKKQNESEEIKDIDLLSEDSSNDHLGQKKIPEKLIEDEDSELNKKKNNITCAENMDLIPEDIKNIINNFSAENQIDNFTQLKICPDLGIFRKTRDLKSTENNEIFLKYFKDEINHAERLKPSEFNEPEGIIEEPEDIENQLDDGHMENAPDGSSQNENGIDPNDIKDIEEPSQENVNLNNFTNVSLSLFKYDDLIEHSEKFGGGNIDILKNLP